MSESEVGSTIQRFLDESIRQFSDPELLEAKKQRLAEQPDPSKSYSPFLLILADARISTPPEWTVSQKSGECYVIQDLINDAIHSEIVAQLEVGVQLYGCRNFVLLKAMTDHHSLYQRSSQFMAKSMGRLITSNHDLVKFLSKENLNVFYYFVCAKTKEVIQVRSPTSILINPSSKN